MKTWAIVLLASFGLLSCFDFDKGDSEVVIFTFQNITGYSAISVMGVTTAGNSEVIVDSNYVTAQLHNKDWTEFPSSFYNAIGLGLDYDKLMNYQSGYFKSILIKADGSSIERIFGKIDGQATPRNYTLELGSDTIIVSEN